MRLKSVIKYNLSELKNSVLLFYAIIAGVFILLSITFVSMTSHGGTGSVGGVEMASVIFLFIVGLNSFKQNFLFLSSNGIARKTQFIGFILAAIPVACAMAAIDTIISAVLSSVIDYNSMFYQIYNGMDITRNSAVYIVVCMIWSAALYMSFVTLGYLITILYYRMSKPLKVVVSVGIPVMFIIIIPTLDALWFKGGITRSVFDLFILLAGLKSGANAWISVAALLVETVVFTGLAYILSRRTVIKE